ncbi:MAG TPA: DNA alkylation repair protein [Vicinamibacterales bacterium]|nr:DNA alkylation repair protein [Vicinamibacterales bacterium]
MKSSEVLATLKKLGKPQTAAIYKRHESGDNVFGVLTPELVKLRKTIKVDHALSQDLWRTGNAEARILALQIADPAKLTRSAMDKVVEESSAWFFGPYVAELVARSPIADDTMRAWMKSKDESFRQIGYGILGMRLRDDPDSVSDADAAKILATIEKEIHGSPNRSRHAMNGALIAIGVAKSNLRKKATEAAKRIGKVQVDHGETNCKTPDAAAYIEKAAKRKR